MLGLGEKARLAASWGGAVKGKCSVPRVLEMRIFPLSDGRVMGKGEACPALSSRNSNAT